MFLPEDKSTIMKLPSGFRDIFPFEACERSAIRETISGIFKSWGYGEVKTPAFEYTSNISIGVGREWRNKLINFFDMDGSLVSLRADMTIPIARLTGMRIKKEQLPVRFYYFSDAFRQALMQKGIKRAYNQAGLELIGSTNKVLADVEVLIILIRIMEKLGLGDFRIGIGHVDLIEGLCCWMNLDNRQKEMLKTELVRKNFVGIGELLYRIDRKKSNMFLDLIQPEQDMRTMSSLIGKIKSPGVNESYEYLVNVMNMLDKFGYGKYLIFDFSIIRDFDYYTGLLFEVYNPGINEIMGSGGRYDRLIKKFGLDVPATGFALDTDLLHTALENIETGGRPLAILAGFGEENFEEAVSIADRLRDSEVSVELMPGRLKNIRKLAEEKGAEFIIEKTGEPGKARITDIRSGSVRKVSPGTFIEGLAGWKT